MATIRVQLTTYLSTDEQLAEWDVVKSHFGDSAGDAAVLRELIHNKAMDIRHGKTRRQSIDRIEEDIRGLKDEQARQREMLEEIAKKVGAEFAPIVVAKAVGCDCAAGFDDNGMELNN